jgi:hypothetical protein
MNPSIIREILKLTEQPGVLSMAGGLPSADTFPVPAIRAACDKVLRDAPREALQYAASEGFAPLREWVAEHVPREWQEAAERGGAARGMGEARVSCAGIAHRRPRDTKNRENARVVPHYPGPAGSGIFQMPVSDSSKPFA